VTRDPLPRYQERPDEEIATNVERALWNDEIIQRLSAPFLQVSVDKGVVTVAGNLATSAHRHRIEDAVHRVRGVVSLQIQAIGDDELEIAVAQALGRDPRTRRFIIPVHATHGNIRLSGDVPAIAPDLARVVPGVRGVELAAR
jgi:osmotically-inducible protein OsmY